MNLNKICRNLFCKDCSDVAELHELISKLRSQNRELSTENEALRKISNFNDAQEDVTYVGEIGAILFALNREFKYDWRGRLKSVEFKGYDLHLYKKELIGADKFIGLYSEVCYNREQNILQSLYIHNFMVNKNMRDNGLGSFVLSRFIDCAVELEAEFVSGTLSFIDIGSESSRSVEQTQNRERLYHFYPKHGFIINSDETIHLQLR
jgi:hypothetical protein